MSWILISLASFVLGIGTARWLAYTVKKNDLTDARISIMIPAKLKHLVPEWVDSADSTIVGDMVILSAAKKYGCNAFFYPRLGENFPLVCVLDEDANGSPDSVSVYGLNGRHVVVNDLDGNETLDSSVYVTGPDVDATHYMDGNMDGEYDQRFGPGKRFSVRIDGNWRDVVIENGKQFVNIGEKLTEIEKVQGIWGKKNSSD